MLHWHRIALLSERASVGHELHASLPVDTLYAEALAEFFSALARLFLLVIVMVVHCLSPWPLSEGLGKERTPCRLAR